MGSADAYTYSKLLAFVHRVDLDIRCLGYHTITYEKIERGGAILFSIFSKLSLARKSYADGQEAVSGALGRSAKS